MLKLACFSILMKKSLQNPSKYLFSKKNSPIIQILYPFWKVNTWPKFDSFISQPAPALLFKTKLDAYWMFSPSWRFWPIWSPIIYHLGENWKGKMGKRGETWKFLVLVVSKLIPFVVTQKEVFESYMGTQKIVKFLEPKGHC